MNLSLTEHQVMNHLSALSPKPSSVKQLVVATKRSREELIKTLKDLSALTLLTVGTKKEVWLRKAGKEFLGIKPGATADNITKADGPVVDEKPAKGSTFKESLINSSSSQVATGDDNVLLHELNALSQQLSKPIGQLKGKAEKVKLLAMLSEKLKPSAPYVSQQLVDIAKVLHNLDEVA